MSLENYNLMAAVGLGIALPLTVMIVLVILGVTKTA